MNLLIYFALPLATILLAIVLQKILRSPILVSITFFAIYLIVAFAAFSDDLAPALVATIIYSLLAFITAYIVSSISSLRRCIRNIICNNNDNNNNNNEEGCCNRENNAISTNDLPLINTDNFSTENSAPGGNVAVTANFIPYKNNNYGTGFVRGCHRRL